MTENGAVEMSFATSQEVMDKIISNNPTFVDGLATVYAEFQNSLGRYSKECGIPLECSIVFKLGE